LRAPGAGQDRGISSLVRRNLFGNWRSTLTTVALVALFVYWLPGLADWALFSAVFRTDADVCQAARGSGACWGWSPRSTA